MISTSCPAVRALHQRPKHERVRARGQVDPHSHRATAASEADRGGFLRRDARTRASARGDPTVGASNPPRPATWSSSTRVAVGGTKPCRSQRVGRERLACERLELAAQPCGGGIEKPRLRPCTTSLGSSGSAAFLSSRFFASPRTLCRTGSENAKFVTTVSRNGTRASSEWAIDARSVFTRRSSTR